MKETEERIAKLEDKTIEIIKSEQKRETRLKRNKRREPQGPVGL